MNSRFINSIAKVATINIRNRTLTSKTTIKFVCKQQLNLSLKYTIPCVRNFGAVAGKEEPFLDPKVVTERIIEVIKNFDKIQKAKVTPIARFKEDLDLDSLDAVEVVMAIEEEFGLEIPDSEADKITSIAEAVAYVSAHPMAK